MSEENVVVRQSMAVKPQSQRRRLEERLVGRFPRVFAFLARAAWRLSPRSRLRQVLLRRTMRLCFEATNRGDVWPFALYHPNCESIFPPQIATLGVESGTHDLEERVRFQRRWYAEWGGFRLEPEELIDLGDGVLMIGRVKGSGLSSGAGFDSEWGVLFTVSGGQVIREQVFLDHGEALKAAGLSE
jgi:ketosteroid isomerase-like protein